LVVYATPLGATLGLLERHRDNWPPEALVSDVAGLKAPVAARVRELGLEHRWIGAHPMTGGEASGFAASRDGLFPGSVVWLVHAGAGADARGRIERAWKALGGLPAWTL